MNGMEMTGEKYSMFVEDQKNLSKLEWDSLSMLAILGVFFLWSKSERLFQLRANVLICPELKRLAPSSNVSMVRLYFKLIMVFVTIEK